MRNRVLVYVAAGLLVFGGCKTIYVPVETVREVSVHDTTFLHRTDTLVQIPDANLSDYINVADTLRISADFATMSAWVDTSFNQLKGRLVQGGKLPIQVVEKERIVRKDSLIYQQVPYPVVEEKKVPYIPWPWKALSVIGIISIAVLCFKLYFKTK